MGKTMRPFIIGCVFILGSCSVSVPLAGYWNPHQADDVSSFSKTEAVCYNSDNELSLKVFNNDKYLDIILETNSPTTLRKIYNLGLSVWVDPSGKSKNVLGFNYPLPAEHAYGNQEFKSYLTRFSAMELQEELMDRFQDYEIVDARSAESIRLSTLHKNEDYLVELKTNSQILFSYRLRLLVNDLYPVALGENAKISIGITNVNEANGEYYSALSSKEVIRRRMDKLKAGSNQNPHELEDWWVNFKLASQP